MMRKKLGKELFFKQTNSITKATLLTVRPRETVELSGQTRPDTGVKSITTEQTVKVFCNLEKRVLS